MTSTDTMSIKTADPARDARTRWLAYALAFSLLLHIGAAVAIIIAGSFMAGGKNTQNIMIQEIALTPSISAPAISSAPPPGPHPAPTATPQTPIRETDIPEQEPAPEQQPEPAAGPGKGGGLMSTPLGLGMTHGYFSGLADGRSLRDDVRSYYFEMVEKINREWWDKAGLLKKPLHHDGVFELVIRRDGTVISLRLLQGTGSGETDRLLAKVIRDASPLPALPPEYELDLFRVPLRIKSPSPLFR